jgi:cytochrome c peroxidase
VPRFVYITFLFLCTWLIACQDDEPAEYADPIQINGHLLWGNVPFPKENAYNDDKWSLGKRLFYDKRLSVDSSISCASCHKPELAFADTLSVSPGVKGRLGIRNAPSLANVGFQLGLNRAGELPTLEMQMLVPIQEHAEFAFNMVKLVDRLAADPELNQLSEKAFGRKVIDPYVITRSMATFERSLVSSQSRLDRYLGGNSAAISANEKKGFQLFKLHCASCHLVEKKPEGMTANNGLYVQYQDQGLMRVTQKSKDEGVFKVPSLQNVAITFPYMHDGSLRTLDQVLAHYNRGGAKHPNQSPLIKELGLSASELADLKAFLLTMTDTSFLADQRYR